MAFVVAGLLLPPGLLFPPVVPVGPSPPPPQLTAPAITRIHIEDNFVRMINPSGKR
jgi:hypothetical protein